MEGVRGSNPLSSTDLEGPDVAVRPFVVPAVLETAGGRAYGGVVFSVSSRAVGAVFDDIVAFFRPTYSHVREEKERLELTREEDGDAAPPLRLGGAEVRLRVPEGYEPPSGPRRHEPPRDSQGLVV